MKKRISFALLAAVLALSVAVIAPASAQGSVDPTLLSFVQAAFTNTLAVNSLSVNVKSSTTSTGGTGGTGGNGGGGGGFAGGGFGVDRTASYQLASNSSDSWNISGTFSTTPSVSNATPEANATASDNTTTEEFVEVDGKTYIRFTEIPQRMQQQNLPTTWMDTSTLAQPGQGQGGGFGFGTPNADQILAELSLPLDDTTVSGISEQAADTIDGAAMRVFQITLNVDALLKSGPAAALIGGGFGGRGGFGGGRGGFGGRGNGGNGGNGAAPQATPPVNAPGNAPAATFEAPSAANTQVTLTVWIGADNFVHRIVSVVARSNMGANGDASMSINTTTDYADFNQAVTISAPAVGT